MFFNLIPTPKIAPKDQKIAPKGPKKVQNRPKMWPNLKQKVRAVPVYIGMSQKSFWTGHVFGCDLICHEDGCQNLGPFIVTILNVLFVILFYGALACRLLKNSRDVSVLPEIL